MKRNLPLFGGSSQSCLLLRDEVLPRHFDPIFSANRCPHSTRTISSIPRSVIVVGPSSDYLFLGLPGPSSASVWGVPQQDGSGVLSRCSAIRTASGRSADST